MQWVRAKECFSTIYCKWRYCDGTGWCGAKWCGIGLQEVFSVCLFMSVGVGGLVTVRVRMRVRMRVR